MEEIRERVYAVTFTPQARGKHRVFVYLNGMEVGSKITFHCPITLIYAPQTAFDSESCCTITLLFSLFSVQVKGSAFSLRIGKDIKEARTTNRNEAFKATNRLSGRYKKLEEQKEENRKSYTEKEVTSSTFCPRQNNHRVTPIRCSLRNRWHRREVSGTRDRASRVSRRTASPCSRRTTPPRTEWTCCPLDGPLPSTAPRRGRISLISTSRSQVDFFVGFAQKRWIILFVARSAGFRVRSRCKSGCRLQPNANHLPTNPTGLSPKFYPP